jgi:Na+/H+-translocating membrane pyrophosphatase
LSKQLEEIKKDLNHPEHRETHYLKGKEIKLYKQAEQASITGDTIGDPLKDTSGPSLNILIKLSSIISVVFGTLFVKTSYLMQ